MRGWWAILAAGCAGLLTASLIGGGIDKIPLLAGVMVGGVVLGVVMAWRPLGGVYEDD